MMGDLPPDLDHDYLRTLDLHKIEPSWDKQGQGSRSAYGGVVFNHHGQVLLVEPTNHFYGYHWTFPKGGSKGEHPVDTGLREVKEESGHDASILGVIPQRWASPTTGAYTEGPSHTHYFLMRSRGQTDAPHWETQATRWASPEEAHKLIDQTTNETGKARDHEVLNMAVQHLQTLQEHPAKNDHLRPPERRENYSHGCGCVKCSAKQGLDRIMYVRRERANRPGLRRILYKLREKSEGHYGGWTPHWQDQVTPAEFIAARNKTKYPGFLSPLEESDITDHKLILSHDHKVGSAISPEGDIQNVFNNGGPQGAGVEAIIHGMHQGGHTLDAFDHYLPRLYAQLGFKETGRVPFNREYAPAGWDYQNHGEPDVVFMSRDQRSPIHADAIRKQALHRESWQPHSKTGRYFDDWDRAKAHSRGEGPTETHGPVGGGEVGAGSLESGPGQRAGGGGSVGYARRDYARRDGVRRILYEIRTRKSLSLKQL